MSVSSDRDLLGFPGFQKLKLVKPTVVKDSTPPVKIPSFTCERESAKEEGPETTRDGAGRRNIDSTEQGISLSLLPPRSAISLRHWRAELADRGMQEGRSAARSEA